MTKLSSIEISKIRNFYRTGKYTKQKLAEKFGVSRKTVQKHTNDIFVKETRLKKLTLKRLEELRSKFKTGKYTVIALAREYGLDQNTVWWHVKDITRGKEYYRTLKIIRNTYSSKPKLEPTLKSTLTEEKAALLGCLRFDGSLTHKKGDHRAVYTTKNLQHAIFVANLFEIEYGIKPFIRLDRTTYKVGLNSSAVCEDILKFGKIGVFKWKVPKEILNGKEQIIAAFLGSFFDDEGTVETTIRNTPRIRGYSANKVGIKQIGNLLKKFGIKYTISGPFMTNKNNLHGIYFLKISDRASLEKFDEKIGFRHPDKNKKLEKLLKNFKRRIGETRNKILTLLEEKNMSEKQLADKLNLPTSTVNSHLRRMRREKLVKVKKLVKNKRKGPSKIRLWERQLYKTGTLESRKKFRLMGITDLSTIDWPRKLAAVVFLQGCNLRCPWCQNVDSIDPRGGKDAEVEDAVKHIEGLKPVIDSIVLTGGEPLLQPEACLKILKAAKKLGLNCAIETNATDPQTLERLLPHLDLVAIDVKAPPSDPKLYEKITGSVGVPRLVQKIGKSIKLAIESNAEVEARTTVVPKLNDDEKIIAQLATDVKGVDCLRLQQFRSQRTLNPSFQGLPSPSREKLLKLARAAKRKGIKSVKIFTIEGGLEEV